MWIQLYSTFKRPCARVRVWILNCFCSTCVLRIAVLMDSVKVVVIFYLCFYSKLKVSRNMNRKIGERPSTFYLFFNVLPLSLHFTLVYLFVDYPTADYYYNYYRLQIYIIHYTCTGRMKNDDGENNVQSVHSPQFIVCYVYCLFSLFCVSRNQNIN